MNSTDRVFVKVLDNYINGRSCKDLDFSGVDTEQFVELVKMHKLVGIFYSCLKDTSIDKATLQLFEMGFYSQVASYQKRSIVKSVLKEMFDKNEIAHIWIKGGHIASLYPNPELRSMSDLDIVIEEKNMDTVHTLLLNKEAEYNQVGSEEGVKVYKLHGINLEIHTNLVSDKVWMNGVDFNEYFSHVFEHRKHQDGYSYVLDDEYNIVYNIFHIAKHFYGSGCGIRMLLDLPVLVRTLRNYSWNNIWKELDNVKLSGFAERIFSLSEKWFGEFGVAYKDKVFIENIELIEDFIIDGGVYGFNGRNTEAVQIKRYGSSREGGYNYVVGMLRWAFPSYKEMRQYSLWFQGKPAIMLPFAYVERFVRNAKDRGGVLKWGMKVVSGRKELDEKDTILAIMKLK